MIFALDVHYGPADICTRVACVGFLEWTSSAVTVERTLDLGPPAAYVPGKFYERELPPLLAVLANMPQPDALVIDGYVWLGDDETPGLGAHLHNALGARIPVVGVAKNSFRGATRAVRVLRGDSRKPLFVTAVGMRMHEAAEHVRSMHGAFRVPTLLRRVDQLARGLVKPIGG